MPEIKFRGPVAQLSIILGDEEGGGPRAIFLGVLSEPPAAEGLPAGQRQLAEWEIKQLVLKALQVTFTPDAEEIAKHPKILVASGNVPRA